MGATTLTYDNNGNLLTDGTNTYNWNARNQLSSIAGGTTATFVYDGLSRRQKKTIGPAPTEFLFDGVNPVQEKDGATVLANILAGLGIDEYFTRTDVPAATTRHFLTDALGSTVALADSETTPTIRTEYTYEPFGRMTFTGEASSNPFQFTGRENDGTGLYYYRARYYHPVFQRFMSEDPLASASIPIKLPEDAMPEGFASCIGVQAASSLFQQSLYSYVLNNPANLVDPSGLIPKCKCGEYLRFSIDDFLACLGRHAGIKLTIGCTAAIIFAGAVPPLVAAAAILATCGPLAYITGACINQAFSCWQNWYWRDGRWQKGDCPRGGG